MLLDTVCFIQGMLADTLVREMGITMDIPSQTLDSAASFLPYCLPKAYCSGAMSFTGSFY